MEEDRIIQIPGEYNGEINMRTIGIITYHAPYNYGSTLQAFATQEIVNELGNNAEIINYRMIPQKDAYALIRRNNGWKIILKDAYQFRYFPKKRKRAEKFERFFNDYLCLTEEFSEPEDFLKYTCVLNSVQNRHGSFRVGIPKNIFILLPLSIVSTDGCHESAD